MFSPISRFAVLALIASSAIAQAAPSNFSYKCTIAPGTSGFFAGASTLGVTFNQNKVRVVDLDNKGSPVVGDLDPTFKGGSSANFVRFINLDSLSAESGTIYMLAPKTIAAGPAKTGVALYWRGESFDSAKYSCVRVK